MSCIRAPAGRVLFVFSGIQLFSTYMYIISKITYCNTFWSIFLLNLYMYMTSKLIYYVTYMYIYPISIQILMLVTNETPTLLLHDSCLRCGRKRYQSLSLVLINNSGSCRIEQPTNLSLSCHVHLGTKATPRRIVVSRITLAFQDKERSWFLSMRAAAVVNKPFLASNTREVPS
jgi:hypothetical protein